MIRGQYKLNLAEAVDSLNRDIPQALRAESDQQRSALTNWDIYTDSFETDFKILDPAMRLLGSKIPTQKIKGLRANQRVLQEFRTLISRLQVNRILESDDVTVSTHMVVDPSTGEEIIESRWTVKLGLKRTLAKKLTELPKQNLAERLAKKVTNTLAKIVQQTNLTKENSQSEPQKPGSTVAVEAVSRFYLNAAGKIYRQSIDELNLLLDEELVDSPEVKKLLPWLPLLVAKRSLPFL